jgi:hypothetical protein
MARPEIPKTSKPQQDYVSPRDPTRALTMAISQLVSHARGEDDEHCLRPRP